jgi:hypothetical protein
MRVFELRSQVMDGMFFKIKSKCNLTQTCLPVGREHKGKCQYKGHKEYIFGVPQVCIELCVLCVNLYFFSLILNSQPQAGPVTMQTFYDQLAPYGNWVNSPAYGYVWVPDVGADFVPYGTAGHWAFTDYGWTWVSDFPWGWATFHYGSWYYDYSMGYVWIPATQWGPAWVSWRSNEGYYGWAPMGPSGYAYPQDRWVFVNAGYISNERVYEHYEPRQNVTVIYNNTTVVQNSYVERNGVRYVLLRRVSPFRLCGMGDSAFMRSALTPSPQPSEGRLGWERGVRAQRIVKKEFARHPYSVGANPQANRYIMEQV